MYLVYILKLKHTQFWCVLPASLLPQFCIVLYCIFCEKKNLNQRSNSVPSNAEQGYT